MRTFMKHFGPLRCTTFVSITVSNKMLSYHRETALQGALVLAKSGKLEPGYNIIRTL